MESPVISNITRDDRIEKLIQLLMNGETHLSYSSLKNFASSPKEFIEYRLREKKQTDAMLYGSMLHCLVLQPEDFFNRYHTIDDTDIVNELIAGGAANARATKKYKEWYIIEAAKGAGKEVVDPQEYKHAKIVADNVIHNRASRKVLQMMSRRETGIEWSYKNFKFKGFIDADDSKIVMADLKSIPDADPKKAYWEIINNYHYLQAAMYIYGMAQNGVEIEDYYIIAVDKLGGVSVHELDHNLLEYGMKEYERLLDAFNTCILTDSWEQSHDFWSKRRDGLFVADKPSRFY